MLLSIYELFAKMKTNRNNIDISNIKIAHDIKIGGQSNSELIMSEKYHHNKTINRGQEK